MSRAAGFVARSILEYNLGKSCAPFVRRKAAKGGGICQMGGNCKTTHCVNCSWGTARPSAALVANWTRLRDEGRTLVVALERGIELP